MPSADPRPCFNAVVVFLGGLPVVLSVSAVVSSRRLPRVCRWVGQFSVVGFSGSRSGPGAGAVPLLGVLAASVGSEVRVGCARGVDEFVRSSCSSPVVFQAVGRSPAALVTRSVRLVRSLAGSPSSLLVVVPGRACPAGLVSGSSWCSGFGSGSWASAALAVGLGVPVLVWVGCPSWLPAWGSWVGVGGGWFVCGG